MRCKMVHEQPAKDKQQHLQVMDKMREEIHVITITKR